MTVTPLAAICLRFDYYVTAYLNAFPVMRDHRLVGTYAAGWNTIDYSTPSSDLPTSWMLRDMSRAGWDIADYTNENMVTYLSSNGDLATIRRLIQQRQAVLAAGVPCDVCVPNQRSWSNELAALALGAGFSWVNNVADETNPQPQPIPNPLYLNQGGSASLSSTTTFTNLTDIMDSAQSHNSVATIVIHKVVPDAHVSDDPAYSIGLTLFGQLCDELVSRQNSGLLRVCRTTDLNPPQYVGP